MTPHFTLLDASFYRRSLVVPLARWCALWLKSKNVMSGLNTENELGLMSLKQEDMGRVNEALVFYF